MMAAAGFNLMKLMAKLKKEISWLFFQTWFSFIQKSNQPVFNLEKQ